MGVSLVYNIDFEVVAIFFLLVINVFMRIKYATEGRVNREFRKLTLFVLYSCILDVLTAITISYGRFIPPVVNLLFNTVYFAMNITLGSQFAQYVSAYIYQENHSKGYRLNIVLYIVFNLMLVANLFTGYIFSFNAEGSYVHGILYYFVYAFPYYYIIYSIGILVIHFKRFTLEQRISIIVLFVLCMVGPLAQMIYFTDVLLSLFTMSVGVLVCMFTLETPDYQRLMKTMADLDDLRLHLQEEVERQTEKSERISLQALKTLAVTIDAKDKYTNGHSMRVAVDARELIRRSGGSEREQEEIY